jgi:CHAD domain-containing protein
MAFRLRPRKTLATELARVVERELRKADEEASHARRGRTAVVHAVRKRIKKVRAVYRLLEEALGKLYRTENERLRSRAHQLADVRDADASLEILKKMRERYPKIVTPAAFASVRQRLVLRRRAAVAKDRPDRLVRRAVGDLRRSARVVSRRIRDIAKPGVVGDGMARAYRRARNSLGEVQANPEDLRFHAWRRQIKAHWYHVRLLEDLSGSARSRATRLKRLETWLGDDHNLVVLRTAILEAPAEFGDERMVASVLGCVSKYHASLRRRALKLGRRMFARPPKRFHRSVEAWLTR